MLLEDRLLCVAPALSAALLARLTGPFTLGLRARLPSPSRAPQYCASVSVLADLPSILGPHGASLLLLLALLLLSSVLSKPLADA